MENIDKIHYLNIDFNNKINILIWRFIIKTIFQYRNLILKQYSNIEM